MSLISVPLSQIDAARLESLRENAVAESRTLEYKERLPESDEDKRELLYDVASLAGTGGDLIYGVQECRDEKGPTGLPNAIVGLPGVNLDKATLSLDNLLLNGIDPRIPGLILYPVPRDPDPPCLIIRVPKSPLGPHMVTYRGVNRFFGRATSGRFPLDWAQVRAGFLEAESAEERLKEFRRSRVAEVLKLAGGDTPIPIGLGPKIILHALPLFPKAVWPVVLTLNETQLVDVLPPMGGSAGGRSWRFNLDGFVMHTVRDDVARQAYSQCFRDSGIEAVSPLDLDLRPQRHGFYGHAVESTVVKALTRYRRLWQLLDMSGPMMVALTLSGVNGAKILARSDMSFLRDETFHRDVAMIPELVVLDVGAQQPAQMLRPLFDLMWNGGGWPRSPWYSDTGEWKPPA